MQNRFNDYLTIRIPASFREQLSEIAARQTRSITDTAREALSQYVAKNSPQPDAPGNTPARAPQMAA